MPNALHYIVPADPDSPHPFGRNVAHDARSENYPYQPRRRVAERVQSRDRWARTIPMLNQAALGSCVPNTGTEWMGTANATRSPLVQYTLPGYGKVDLTDGTAAETSISDADGLYHDLTELNPQYGVYEPADPGSDGTSLGNEFLKLGLIGSFDHVFTAGPADWLDALTHVGPLWFGCNWYDSMFEVNDNGDVTISPDAALAGGHEIILTGAIDVVNQRAEFGNHWVNEDGTLWGWDGYGWMHWDLIERLRGEDGDVTVPHAVAAVPVPDPQPAPVDGSPVLLDGPNSAAVLRWGRRHGITDVGAATNALVRRELHVR